VKNFHLFRPNKKYVCFLQLKKPRCFYNTKKQNQETEIYTQIKEESNQTLHASYDDDEDFHTRRGIQLFPMQIIFTQGRSLRDKMRNLNCGQVSPTRVVAVVN
jgi:hypothetical protein